MEYAVNPACFGRPNNAGDIGNLSRNFVRRPSTFNNDIAIFKNIKLGENREIQLRWEVYNIFNHTNFSDIFSALSFTPDGAVTALAAGGTCPAGTVLAYAAAGANPARCASTSLGVVSQTDTTFGAPKCGPLTARDAGIRQN